jgi:hypothetical protein
VTALTAVAGGCTTLSSQLAASDPGVLDSIESREDREQAYDRERIRTVYDPRGKRFKKGDAPDAPLRGWQSLDVVLRSDANSAAALPRKKLTTSRVLMSIALASGVVAIAGAAATAREALNLKSLNGPGAVLLGGAALGLGFGLGAGITYGQARRGYERAVGVYNDSLGVRLGLYTPAGEYIPPAGTVMNEDGFIMLRDQIPTAMRRPNPTVEGDPDGKRAPSVDAGAGPSPVALRPRAAQAANPAAAAL